MDVVNFFDSLKDAKTERKAIRRVFERVMAHLDHGETHAIQCLLDTTDPEELGLTVALAFLAITCTIPPRSVDRKPLYDKIYQFIEKTDPARTQELLHGLEPRTPIRGVEAGALSKLISLSGVRGSAQCPGKTQGGDRNPGEAPNG